jgi:outer membrane protein assembly factor BamB
MLSPINLGPILLLLSVALNGLPSKGQEIEYLKEPELVKQTQIGVVLDGNGVFTSPNDKVAVVTQANGNINAFNPFSGEQLWSFRPPVNNGLPTSCQGGATFSTEGPFEYVVYSVIDDPNGITPLT